VHAADDTHRGTRLFKKKRRMYSSCHPFFISPGTNRETRIYAISRQSPKRHDNKLARFVGILARPRFLHHITVGNRIYYDIKYSETFGQFLTKRTC